MGWENRGASLMGTSYAFEAAAATAALASPKAAQTCWQVYKMKLYYTSHSGPLAHTHIYAANTYTYMEAAILQRN